MGRLLTAVLLGLLLCLRLPAEDIYVSQPGAGAGTGADAANAEPLSWLNNGTNWGAGAGKVSPGDTVHLCGTFTSQLTVAGNGSAGNVVTLLFETSANFTAGCWPTDGAIVFNGNTYITLDGGTNGTIQNTSNGTGHSIRPETRTATVTSGNTTVLCADTSGFQAGKGVYAGPDNLGVIISITPNTSIVVSLTPPTNRSSIEVEAVIQSPDLGAMLATQNNSRGIGGSAAGGAALSHGVIKNLIVTHIYRKETGVVDDTRAGYCISLAGTDLTVENCQLSDGDGLITYSASDTTQQNIIFRNNTLRNANHMMTIGVGDTDCHLTNLRISGNDLDHWDNWDCPGNTQIHLDGIILQNNTNDPSSIMEDVWFYQNRFGGYVGTRTTAAIFNSMQNPSVGSINWRIFNNLFLCNSGFSWGNGFVAAFGPGMQVFNNSFIGVVGPPNYGGGLAVGGSNSICKNNILLSGGGITLYNATGNDETARTSSGADTEYILTTYFSDIYSDYNIFGGDPSFQIYLLKLNNQDNWLSGLLNGFTVWQTWNNNNRGMTVPIWNTAHADPNSSTSTVTFDATGFVPASNDTVARGHGANLTSTFTAMGLPAVDFYGNPRSASGTWTIGAFEQGAPGTSTINATLITGTIRVGN